jgi:hypothetical protein
MVYSNQTESWLMEATSKCSGKEHPINRNMPFTETPNEGNQRQYHLALTSPSVWAGTDDAMFADPRPYGDPFAAADGISGRFIMKGSSYVAK